MTTYRFTLLVDGADLQTPKVQDALFEAGCDDAAFGTRKGVQYAEFDRQAQSYDNAVESAITAIKRVAPKARVQLLASLKWNH